MCSIIKQDAKWHTWNHSCFRFRSSIFAFNSHQARSSRCDKQRPGSKYFSLILFLSNSTSLSKTVVNNILITKLGFVLFFYLSRIKCLIKIIFIHTKITFINDSIFSANSFVIYLKSKIKFILVHTKEKIEGTYICSHIDNMSHCINKSVVVILSNMTMRIIKSGM